MSQEEFIIEDKEWLNERIDRGLLEFQNGQFYTAEESRADMEKRKAAWLAERNPQTNSLR